MLRASVATTVLFAALVLFLFSPFVRVQTVVWTGRVTLDEDRYAALEATTLGRSLWLLSEKTMSGLLATDPGVYELRFRRHPPHTLEVCIQPRHAIARLPNGAVVDADGRVASGVPIEDLPLLHAVDVDADKQRVDAGTRALLRVLHDHLPTAAVRLRSIERSDEGWMLTLAETGSRVRLSNADLAEQVEKLRVYEQSLAQGELPAAIDLRWRGQIVLERQPGKGQRVRG